MHIQFRGPDETLSTAGIVHHSVVAISRISLPTAYYGVRCANGFSAVFSSWEGARPSIEGHHVVHGKFKTEHQAAVLAFHGINLRTSPNTSYPPYVPEIVLDAAPADYRKRPRHAPSVVNQSAPAEQVSSHTSGFRGDAECSTVSERVNRSAQTGCRSDLFVSVPHQSDALEVCPNGERPGTVGPRLLLPDVCTPDLKVSTQVDQPGSVCAELPVTNPEQSYPGCALEAPMFIDVFLS